MSNVPIVQGIEQMPLSLKKECTRGNSGCRTALNGEVLTDNADDNTVPMLS